MAIIGKTYTHIQTVPSTVWLVEHNLGTDSPVVNCWLDISGEILNIKPFKITPIDIKSCEIHFTINRIGTAIIA